MADWGAGASGAVSGAATGASVGGVPGAVVGGLVGGVTGLFGSKKKKAKKRSTFDKKQQALNDAQHQSILGEGPLADLYNYNPEAANDVFTKTIANPAYREYQEKLAPQITGQFRKEGLMNSSYAGDALARTARDIQEGLDAQRTQYLYGQEKDAKTAKRNAVENLQNRQTFAYDTAAPSGGGFNLDSVLSSISPEMIQGASDWLTRGNGPGVGGAKTGGIRR